MSSGVEEPPGVQNFSSWPSRIPPDSSNSCRRVMPNGASYCPGRRTWPDSEYSVKPLLFSVPMLENHAAPPSTMLGTLAIDSTLLTTVGLA